MDKVKKATIFKFTSYILEPHKKRVVFNYKTEFSDKSSLSFTEAIIFPKEINLKHIPAGVVEKLLESLHIILGISYYKFYCPQKVKLPYQLSKKEADFWSTVYKKGLGEFFYKNNLDPNISPKFEARNSKLETISNFKCNLRDVLLTKKISNSTRRCLVGIGGGKDSIVVAELLKEQGFETTAFHVQTNKESELVNKVIETIGIGELKIERFLDWQVFQAHQYNGHVPVSAIYAFLGVLTAVLYDYSYVVMGNEYSSNFGNIKYRGLDINHQWSKSFEFEKLFQDYVRDFVTLDVLYFSLMRNFYEIRIVEMFSQYKKYFSVFSSCNGNFKLAKQQAGLWCGQCAKCVFTFILLSAFLEKQELVKIFGKNLYQDESLLDLFKDVLGLGKLKPFDCVGTFEEAQTAMFLAKDKFSGDFIMSRLLGNRGSSDKNSKEFLSGRQLSGKVTLRKETLKTSNQTNAPESFRFLGLKNALILGYGKEGKVTEEFLKQYYPKIKIGIADSKEGSDYLKNQTDFSAKGGPASGWEIAIKTPCIKKELVTIPYTTATNIFFSKVRQLADGKNMIIGVTGSKGKSTTSSLIFEILKTAGKNVVLLGNIGKPMLEYLLSPVQKDTIFVLELSSYQLDDIKFSPDIAVVTNLFPEHMDFHGSLKNYYEAKKNIIRFQNENQYFVHNEKTKSWLKNYKGEAVTFSKKLFKNNLIGEHNQSNIGAAVSVAKILGIKDSIIKKAVGNFKGLPHRLEFIGEHKGIRFYDDAISTTPDSTIMAIKALKKIDTIFLGGQDRGYNFSLLEKTIKKYKISNVVLFPDSGDVMLKKTSGLNVLKTDTMEKAVRFAYENTKKGSICLLSCASPSYSLWKNFEEKGEQFKAMVKKFSKT